MTKPFLQFYLEIFRTSSRFPARYSSHRHIFTVDTAPIPEAIPSEGRHGDENLCFKCCSYLHPLGGFVRNELTVAMFYLVSWFRRVCSLWCTTVLDYTIPLNWCDLTVFFQRTMVFRHASLLCRAVSFMYVSILSVHHQVFHPPRSGLVCSLSSLFSFRNVTVPGNSSPQEVLGRLDTLRANSLRKLRNNTVCLGASGVAHLDTRYTPSG